MVRILFHELNVGEISNTSGVFSGENKHTGWKSWRKTNEGFGTFDGAQGAAADSVFVVIDRDLIDTLHRRSGS